MAKQFVKRGIDHGTSNSSIAVMEKDGPRIVKVNGVDEIMPSAVYLDKRGRQFVGRPAYEAMAVNRPEEGTGYTGYKIRIGQDDQYEFPQVKRSLSAPQLGSIVIGELLKACREDTGEDAVGAVITVPAKFEHGACEGTREAARLAGLKFCPLIQEPIAAAMAYGFTAADARAQWMIFDLGGGTLDISMVIVRDGEMVVPEAGHAGDNRLGGRKFDRELFEYVKGQLQKQYALGTFGENSPAYRQAWGRLMIACEQAKIQLSSRTESVVEVAGVLCKDERGQDVKVEVPISRSQYEKMIAPSMDLAVHLCRELLKSNRMSAQDLTKLILVGGPTKTPYIQQALAAGLGVDVRPDIDPMTAVALGAAIHAGTTEIPPDIAVSVAVPETVAGDMGVRVTLSYESSSKLTTCFVAGKVEGDVVAGGGLSVEIRRSDGWSSGALPVSAEGLFDTDLVLLDRGRRERSDFVTTVTSRTGQVLATVEEPQIWYPYVAVDPRLANSLLVAVRGNRTEPLVKKGVNLPAKGREKFKTVNELRRGSSEDVLRIEVMEGVTHLFGEENEDADCCVLVGTLLIKGDSEKIRQNLPAGSEIDITVTEDESRLVKCLAYIPLLDEEFEAEFTKSSFGVTPEQTHSRFTALQEVFKRAEVLEQARATEGVAEKLKTIRDLKVMDEIARELDRAQQGERDAFYRAYRKVLELAGALQQVTKQQRKTRIQEHVSQLMGVVEADDKKALKEIDGDLSEAAEKKDEAALQKVEEFLAEVDARVRLAPVIAVHLDVQAEAGKRVNARQAEAFKRCDVLLDRVLKKGLDKIDDADLQEARAAHKEMEDSYPTLYADIREMQQKRQEEGEKPDDRPIPFPRSLGGDIDKGSSHSF